MMIAIIYFMSNREAFAQINIIFLMSSMWLFSLKLLITRIPLNRVW